jgi:hypothetical protein
MHIEFTKKVVALLVAGVFVLLALVAGTSLLVVNAQNSHNQAVAAAVHNRQVASAKAQAERNRINKAIADANTNARKARREAAKARAAADKPAPPVVVVPAPAPPVAVVPGANGDGYQGQISQYASDILNAGIVADPAWIDSTGSQLVYDWNILGYSVAWTDVNVLEAGGISPGHVATFDYITAQDLEN